MNVSLWAFLGLVVAIIAVIVVSVLIALALARRWHKDREQE